MKQSEKDVERERLEGLRSNLDDERKKITQEAIKLEKERAAMEAERYKMEHEEDKRKTEVEKKQSLGDCVRSVIGWRGQTSEQTASARHSPEVPQRLSRRVESMVEWA